MSITQDQLIAAGYIPFKQKHLRSYTDNFYQKLVADVVGKKYYITVAVYDNRQYQDRLPQLEDLSYRPFVQFTDYNGLVFDVEIHSPKSVEEIDQFCDKIWCSLVCSYYEQYERNTE